MNNFQITHCFNFEIAGKIYIQKFNLSKFQDIYDWKKQSYTDVNFI